MRPLIYTAGPFRSRSTPYNYWEQVQFIRASEEVSLAIWTAGGVAVSPHLLTANFQGALPDQVWLEGDLALLARCDGVLMLPGWQDSSGACAEYEFARKREMSIWVDLPELTCWLMARAA